MCCYCYILFSPSLGKFYTGITQESIDSRIQKHNLQQYGNHRYTAKASDWELFLAIEADDYAHARRMELYIKKMKSAAYIRKLKDNPFELNALVAKKSRGF
ncbi:putative endonuclease [Algoriphagus faecimaris]|uniref:Putative endonuclease n=2 Tax=Algoriphagus faecimaris TaxID=686796 RepID=A0A1G6RM57_9BACT|nr:GIY-YIG nuclease family protein [Algoriphagus faecimaris]SDD05037.1 putative endonuclease [Algoriphagus faecimaris]